MLKPKFLQQTKKFSKVACYAFLTIFIVWLFSASVRIFIFTKSAENLINRVQPYEQAGNKSKRILFLGDSFAYGVGASSSRTTLAGQFGNYLPEATIINRAQNGTKTLDLANRIESDIDGHYDIIIIIVGVNNIIHPEVRLKQSRQHYQTIYSKAASSSNNVIAITTDNFSRVTFFLRPLNYYFGYRSEVINQLAREEAEKYKNITYINALNYNYNHLDPKLFESEDRLHLNDLGIDFWFQKILENTNNLSFEIP